MIQLQSLNCLGTDLESSAPIFYRVVSSLTVALTHHPTDCEGLPARLVPWASLLAINSKCNTNRAESVGIFLLSFADDFNFIFSGRTRRHPEECICICSLNLLPVVGISSPNTITAQVSSTVFLFNY